MEFSKILEEVKAEIKQKASGIFPENKEIAEKDADVFLSKSKQKIELWATAVAKGEMSVADMEWLVKSQQSLKEMKNLQEKGLARIKIDEFQNQIINSICSLLSKLKP